MTWVSLSRYFALAYLVRKWRWGPRRPLLFLRSFHQLWQWRPVCSHGPLWPWRPRCLATRRRHFSLHRGLIPRLHRLPRQIHRRSRGELISPRCCGPPWRRRGLLLASQRGGQRRFRCRCSSLFVLCLLPMILYYSDYDSLNYLVLCRESPPLTRCPEPLGFQTRCQRSWVLLRSSTSVDDVD